MRMVPGSDSTTAAYVAMLGSVKNLTPADIQIANCALIESMTLMLDRLYADRPA